VAQRLNGAMAQRRNGSTASQGIYWKFLLLRLCAIAPLHRYAVYPFR
jgi:hypothetical protein